MNQILHVFQIVTPVFAVVALGKLLAMRGWLTPGNRRFINWFVFHICLPALIFRSIATQRLGDLFAWELVLPGLVPVLIGTVVFILVARALRLRGESAGIFICAVFWANVSYAAFPLSVSAFGDAGLRYAALYNATVMPIFVLLAFSLIGLYSGMGVRSTAGTFGHALFNPVVLSALLAIAVAAGLSPFRGESGALPFPAPVLEAGRTVLRILKFIGTPGLALALLSIGSTLRVDQLRGHGRELALAAAGKLLLLPALSLLTLRLLFPGSPGPAGGTAVLLSAMPNAVAYYVIVDQMGKPTDFISSAIVLTTLLSVFTIPLWLLFVV